MADVVADFHVLDALGERQRRGADQPAGPGATARDEQTRSHIERALERDGATNVGSVSLPQRGLDLAADAVQFVGQRVDVRLAEVRVHRDVGDGQSGVLSRCRGCSCRLENGNHSGAERDSVFTLWPSLPGFDIAPGLVMKCVAAQTNWGNPNSWA